MPTLKFYINNYKLLTFLQLFEIEEQLYKIEIMYNEVPQLH